MILLALPRPICTVFLADQSVLLCSDREPWDSQTEGHMTKEVSYYSCMTDSYSISCCVGGTVSRKSQICGSGYAFF